MVSGPDLGHLWPHGQLYDKNPAEPSLSKTGWISNEWNRPKTVIFRQTFCLTYWWDLQMSCYIAWSTICISTFSFGAFRGIISLFRIFILIRWSIFLELEYWFTLVARKSILCFAWRWISSVQLRGCTSWSIIYRTNFYNAMIVNCITAFCLKIGSLKIEIITAAV